MITLLIVSFNSASTLIQCQAELLASGRFPVVVIDNASTDGSADRIAKAYPSVRVLRMDRNMGYGRAANRGLAEVETPYAFLLNPDLEVTADGVQSMLDFAQTHASEASLFAPAVVERDARHEGAMSRDWIIGAAMLFKMKNFEDVGFFDESIFLFYEETDLCRRLRQRGQRILLNTDVHMHHLGGQSSCPNSNVEALKNWHRGWSYLYYLRKHGLIQGWWAPRRLYLRYVLKALLARKQVKRDKYLARAAGIRACLSDETAYMTNGLAKLTDQL